MNVVATSMISFHNFWLVLVDTASKLGKKYPFCQQENFEVSNFIYVILYNLHLHPGFCSTEKIATFKRNA